MAPLNHQQRMHFLAEPHVAVLAVGMPEGAPPLQVPLWYHYRAGDPFLWIATPRDSVKARRIREQGGFSMLVQRQSPTIRYAGVRGKLLAEYAATRDDLREMAARYLPAEDVEEYVEWDWTAHGPYQVFRLSLDHWNSQDLGAWG